MIRALALVSLLAGVAAAEDHPFEPLDMRRPDTDPRLYIEPAFLVEIAGHDAALTRVGVGLHLGGKTAPLDLRIGGAGYVGGGGGFGAGGELEVAHDFGSVTLGLYGAGMYSEHRRMFYEVGLRAHRDVWFAEAGASHLENSDLYANAGTRTYVGVGLQERPGRIVGGIELAIGAVVLGVLALSNPPH